MENAIEAYARSVELAPNLAPARVNLGAQLFKAGRSKDAESVSRTLERKPRSVRNNAELTQERDTRSSDSWNGKICVDVLKAGNERSSRCGRSAQPKAEFSCAPFSS